MKNYSKFLALALAVLFFVTACAGGNSTTTEATKAETTLENSSETKAEDNTAETNTAETNTEATSENTADKTTDTNVLVVGATPNPHAELLEMVKPVLEKEGIALEIKVFTDYIIPNSALEEKELDANFFQHQPYLDEFQKNHGTHLKSVGGVHVEPIGLYSKSLKSLDELKDGATIAIPNDPTNGGRALILLEKHGLITIKEGVEKLTATDLDVDKNEKNLKFQLLDAAMLPRTLEEVDAAVINTNFALEAGLNPVNDAIIMEDKDSPYANLVVTREDNANDPKIQALMKALQSDEIKKFIEEQYKGAIVPGF